MGQINNLLHGLEHVLRERPVDELILPILVGRFYIQLLHGEAKREGLAQIYRILEPDVDILDADLDVVNDLTGEVHDEALLLLQIGRVACRFLDLLCHILKELHGVLDQLLLKDLERVLSICKVLPL